MNAFLQRLAGLALAALAAPALALDLPGPVVDSAWLAKNLGEVQVVEVRSDFASFSREPVFETDKKSGKKTLAEVGGHLPGARLVDFKVVRAERQVGDRKLKYLIPEKADFQTRMQAAGIVADKPIVLVPVAQDIADIDEALRLYWSLKVYGEDRLVDVGGTQGTRLHLLGQRAHSVDQLGATAVVDGQAQSHAGVVARHPDVLVDLPQHR